jgi:hypothetical protein
MMTTSLPLSSRLYGRMLRFYPEDLRRDFGTEMAFVFAEDLAAARREAGFAGMLRVWRCALAEFVRLGLPGQAARPAIRVPVIVFALTYLTIAGEFVIGLAHKHPEARYLEVIGVALLLPSMSAFFVSFASVWSCRGNTTISLGLSDPRRERQECSKSAI